MHRPVSTNSEVIILGHGGLGIRSRLPIDSEKSISQALEYPIDGVEIDVKMTQDSVLVSFHADKMESVSDCEGSIYEKRWNELSGCGQRGWFGQQPISAVNDLLQQHQDRPNTIISLDLKPDSENESELRIFTRQIALLVGSYPKFRFLIESNRATLLNDIKTLQPSVETFYYCNDIHEGIEVCNKFGLDGISIDMKFIASVETVRKAQSQGQKVMLWGSGSVFSNRKMLELNPDLVQTDDISSMMRIRD